MTALLSVTGAGTQFLGEFCLVGRLESNFCPRPRRNFSGLPLNELNLQRNSHIPKTKTLNFKTRGTPLLLAYGEEAEDRSLPNANEDTDVLFDDANEEDTDVMFDDVLKRYGEVVFSTSDQKPLTSEADDDSESLSFSVEMAKVASDVKAGDIKVLFVKPLVYWTKFFIIATAFSLPQVNAIGTRIRDLAETKYGRIANGDTKPNSWTLLDFGDVVIHIFLPEDRAFYNLEEFYGNATPIELPSENQPPFRN